MARSKMRGLTVILLLIGLMAGGVCFLMFKDIPVTRKPVEKELNSAQFFK